MKVVDFLVDVGDIGLQVFVGMFSLIVGYGYFVDYQ